MNVGLTVFAPAKATTTGPPVCVQVKNSVSPSGSELPEPSCVTSTPDITNWIGPASARGALFVNIVVVFLQPNCDAL